MLYFGMYFMISCYRHLLLFSMYFMSYPDYFVACICPRLGLSPESLLLQRQQQPQQLE